eukprot:TRINITY_DN37649_c0_g1_i1.p1 TRINITY_DN37649_c0_g1~~TRINITY_DN37649_c0_g1_i1.p1  ORF type:complete len:205 (+),score=59.50 TRINITY_DN37649_c0_g1_i1:116-730(+)
MGSFLQTRTMDRLAFSLSVFIWGWAHLSSTEGVASCAWGCTPIKSCAVIYSDLVTAKIAKETQEDKKVDKIISLIRGYTCDDKAQKVCCPAYMGQLNNTITRTVDHVYAVTMDTIMIRSSMEESRWINTEAFFWREKSCFPMLDYQVDLDHHDEERGEERLEETRMVLAGTLTVEDVRCLSVWAGDREVGYAHLAWAMRTPKDG